MPSAETEIIFYQKEYLKQRKLEVIITQRQLSRPTTKKWHVVLLFSIVPLLIFFAIFLSFLLPFAVILNKLIFILLLFLIFESYIRLCLLKTVECYQHYAKKETRQRCMCVPSCSEYAIICLRKIFPLAVALVKIRIRLYRTCKGEDYKLDFPLKKMNSEFEIDNLN